jgi:hypothetical protein
MEVAGGRLPTSAASNGAAVARTIDDVLAGLDRVIARALEDGDRAGYFAVLYRKVTAKVKEGIAAGFFDDPARMERLDVLFADRYLDAVTAARADEAVTDAWRLTFDAAARGRSLILQHLLVGINAHINLDLGVAAARCAPGAELPGLRRDYDRVNATLAAMIASVQEDLRLVSPWLGLLDRFGARTQSEVIRFSIVTARAGAWRFAEQLAGTAEPRWDTMIVDRDRRVAAVGQRILRPGRWTGAGLWLVRLRERDDVRANLQVLLGAEPPSLEEVAATLDRLPGPGPQGRSPSGPSA